MVLIAYHNDLILKQRLQAHLQVHHDRDEIVQGTYWEDGKGCAVGCSLQSLAEIKGDLDFDGHDNHELYESLMGVPVVLAELEDRIFESLPNGEAKQWPLDFAAAIQPGADLSGVWNHIGLWLLADQKYGVVWRTEARSPQRKAIQRVMALYRRQIAGDYPSFDEWRAAAWAAEAAAKAAEVAAWVAEAAARAAWVAEAAARESFWRALAAKMLEFMRAAPMAGVGDEEGFRWTSNHPIDRGIAMPVCDHCEPC